MDLFTWRLFDQWDATGAWTSKTWKLAIHYVQPDLSLITTNLNGPSPIVLQFCSGCTYTLFVTFQRSVGSAGGPLPKFP